MYVPTPRSKPPGRSRDLGLILAGCALAFIGCDGAEEAEHAEPAEVALQQAVAAVGEPCPSFGESLCKDTQLSCEEAAAITGALAFTPADCEELTKSTESVMTSVMTVWSDQQGTATVELMRIALTKATNVTDTQRAGFDAWVRAARDDPPALSAGQLASVLRGVSCTGAGTPRSRQSVEGLERWCEVNGVRHGPAKLLNPEGQVVRKAQYFDGKLLRVEYVVPTKGSLAASAFICPDGTRRDQTKEDGGTIELSCEGEGNVTKVAVRQAGERIVEVVPTNSAEERFVGFMEQPEG